MAEELTFYVDSGAGESTSVDMISCTWMTKYGIHNFTPAMLRVMADLFLGNDSKAQTVPNFIIYFGKFTETVKFNVQLESDTAWKNFRKFASQTSFFETSFSNDKPLHFYWGGSGDPFYSGQNNVGNLTKFSGMFSASTFTRVWPEQYWKGTITFMIGEVIQA